MARGTNTDFATTLGMLHTAVTNTGNDLRDALGKSVEKLETSGRAVQQETTRAVVDELGRMRVNLRETRDRLSTGGEMLNTEVRQAVAELRTEMRGVRDAVEGITSPAPSAASTESVPPAYESAVRDTSGSGAATFFDTALKPAPVSAATDRGELPADSVRPAVPTQRDGSDIRMPDATVLPVDLIQQAVRDVLAEELAPLSAFLAEKKDGQDVGTATRDDVRVLLRETVRELREHLDAARQEARTELTALREECDALRAGLEKLRPKRSDEEPASAEVGEEHTDLLKQAARVSSVDLLCHRDVWEFITAQAGRHPHFRVPPQVAGEGDERIRAAVSGRSVIALLISLHAVRHTAHDGDGDRELAATLYERIQTSLTALTAQGQPVTITLDDRSSPVAGVPSPGNSGSGRAPEPVTDDGQGDGPQPGPSGEGDRDRPS